MAYTNTLLEKSRVISTFRQIAMNRFEDAIHRERRERGELSQERFGELWMGTQKEMFAVEGLKIMDEMLKQAEELALENGIIKS